MPQIGDIELAGTSFMLAPGSYHRTSDGPPEGRNGRVEINDFVGGQHRALQMERDTSWDSAGVGPALFGQGVEPWPRLVVHTDAVISPVSSAQRVHAIAIGDHVYLGIGRYVYRTVSIAAPAWANVTQVADLGAGRTITGLAWYQGSLAIATGNGLDIRLLDLTTLAITTLLAGFKGNWIVGYANRLIASDPTPGNESVLKMTTGGGLDTRELDSPITNMTLHGGKVAIATRSGIWLLGGRSDPAAGKWLGEPEPLFSHGTQSNSSDYRFLASFGGKLYTYLAGEVMEWNPNAGSTRQGWRSAGLEGRQCYGGTVAGNRLVVSIQSRSGSYELWAWDGSGWWLMSTTTLAARVWPAFLAGAGGYDLVAFWDGDANVAYDLYGMVNRSATLHSFASSGFFVTSMLDAGDRTSDKAWRSIGAQFAAPFIQGNPASSDQIGLTLAWSIDGGATWTTAATTSSSNPGQRVHTLSAELDSDIVTSPFLQIRVGWTSIADWAPVLTGVWAEYAMLDAAARRRRWSLAVQVRDGVICRDGSRETQSGRQLSDTLWTAWETKATVDFRDVDYDVNTVERRVRIIDIEEIVAKPADAARWGESTVRLTLAEV
ncbi:MAG: hypothetical protein KF883_00205 [Thermomicrobiales bacterium]|nr:hypothetical protein [Thermomicrobiales bacterium]